MNIDSSKLAQGVAALLLATALGFIWNAHSQLATIEARLTGVEDVLDGVLDTFDVLHPRGSALAGGPSERAEGMKARLERIQQRAPEPPAADDDDSGDDDDSAGAP